MSVTPSIKSWDELPLIVPIEQVCELYGQSYYGIWRMVKAHRGIPQPMLTNPMRWSRADLQRHWEGRSAVATVQHRKKRMAS